MASPTKRPVRRRRPVSDGSDEDEGQPTRRPSRRPVRPSDNGDDEAVSIRGGWNEGQKQMDAGSSYAQALKLDKDLQMVKFLEDVPYANFRRHWVDHSSPQGSTRRAYTCLATVNQECPLCDIGDRVQAVSAFNIALIDSDGDVLHKTWDVGVRLFNVLKAFGNDPKVGPLSKHFFAVSKTGSKQNSQTNVIPVKTTALVEDYDVTPPDPEELEKVKLYTPDIIEIETRKKLAEIAAEMADDYE